MFMLTIFWPHYRRLLLAGAGSVSRPHPLLLLPGALRPAAAVGALARGAGAGGSSAAATVCNTLVTLFKLIIEEFLLAIIDIYMKCLTYSQASCSGSLQASLSSEWGLTMAQAEFMHGNKFCKDKK